MVEIFCVSWVVDGVFVVEVVALVVGCVDVCSVVVVAVVVAVVVVVCVVVGGGAVVGGL